MKSAFSLSRRKICRVLLPVFGLALAGCLSPTLPLPPPGDPIVSVPNEAGEVSIKGRVSSRAKVFVQNDRTDQIVGEVTGESGQYELQMQAQVGDVLFVWERAGTTDSPATQVEVPSESQPTIQDPVVSPGGASGQ